MSSSLASPNILAASFPALAPAISAAVTDDLFAAVPKPPADPANPDGGSGRETTLIGEIHAFHPRDLEETTLVVQYLSAYHGAVACLRAAAACDVTSREASRLRRDAVVFQRSMQTILCALHKSQARPISEDEAVPRPAVPVARPHPIIKAAASRQHPPAGSDKAPPASRRAEHQGSEPGNADPEEQVEAGGSPGDAATQAPDPPPPADPFKGDPSLRRLNNRWKDLEPWERMTMEERRETWGYNYTPPVKADPAALDSAGLDRAAS
jgi:hypothetical protein